MIFFNTKGFVSELNGTIFIQDRRKNKEGTGFLIIFDSSTQQSFDTLLPNVYSVESFFLDWKKKIEWEKQEYDFCLENIEFEKVGVGRTNTNKKYIIEINIVYDDENSKLFFVTLKLENEVEQDCTYFIDNVYYIINRYDINNIEWS